MDGLISNRNPKTIVADVACPAYVEECIESPVGCQNSDVSDFYTLGSGFGRKIVGRLRT
jgi:hypothetical protein